MTNVLRSMLIGFGIETSGEEKLTKIDAQLDGIAAKFKMIGAAAAGAFIFKGLTSFITDQVDTGAALSYTAEKLGVTVDELERYRFATAQAGVEQQAAERALMMFNRQLGEAELGTKAAGKGIGELTNQYTAQQLSAMPLNDLLGLMADRFQGITDRGQKAQLAMKLFGRQGAALIPLFDQGSKGMENWMATFDALGGGMGENFAQESRLAEQSIKRLTFVWDVLKSTIVGSILPAVEKVTLWFTRLVTSLEWLEKHSYMAQTAIIALCAAAVVAMAPFLAAIAPIVAAFTALYLVFDDIYTLFAGGDSVIGEFLNKIYGLEGAKKIVENIKQAFKDFIQWVSDTGIPAVREFAHYITQWQPDNGVRSATSDWQALLSVVKQAYHFLNASHKIAMGDFEGAQTEWNIATHQDRSTPDDELDPDSDEFKRRRAEEHAQGRADTVQLLLKKAKDKNALVAPEVLGQRLADIRSKREAEERAAQEKADQQSEIERQLNGGNLNETGATVNVTINPTINTAADAQEVQDIINNHLERSIQETLAPLPFVPNKPIPPAK